MLFRSKSGEIGIFDRGYSDYEHFADLSAREVIWVTRAKEGMQYDLLDEREVEEGGKILSDEIIALTNGLRARRIVAKVEIDGKEREMTFLTNQMDWAASTIVALYEARWEIEVFFRELKQTCKLCDLMSYSANGIRREIWTALLVQLLLRYMAWVSKWGQAFTRLYALIGGTLWLKRDIKSILEFYGTGSGGSGLAARPEQAYLAGFA